MASLVNRYTDALLGVTNGEDSTQAVEADLRVLGHALEDRSFRLLLENPAVQRAKKSELLGRVLAAGERSVHGRTSRFLEVVLERGRQGLLREIVSAFRAKALEQRGEVEGVVETALELADDELASLADKLSGLIGKKVLLSQVVSGDLLGGFRVRVADRMFDASLKGQLESLGRKLKGISISELRPSAG